VLIAVQGRPAPEGAWTTPGGPWAARAVGAVGLVFTLSALICTLAPSPDAPDKAAAVVKLVLASAVLIGAGAGAYALSRQFGASALAQAERPS
jgi:predicted MFS family arabinose efflux permease